MRKYLVSLLALSVLIIASPLLAQDWEDNFMMNEEDVMNEEYIINEESVSVVDDTTALSSPQMAQEGEEHGITKEEDAKIDEVVPTQEMVKVGNKICPVSKSKVGEMGPIVEISHNGKVYNLCCAMCAKDFLKDPEKFSKIAEEEVNPSTIP